MSQGTPSAASSIGEETLPAELALALGKLAIVRDAGQIVAARRLTGGVSSDIWRVETLERMVCIKRALPRLKVAAIWEAPVERNRYERLWYLQANTICPGVAPQVLAYSDADSLFVMNYLPPERHALWKSELARGRVDADFAASVGARLGAIHRATARRADIAATFPTDDLFEQLRLEPYLRFTGARHPDLAPRLNEIADAIKRNRIGLVHGDVSPKNILVGPDGPVFLDAECVWFGDVVFDPAFCLNHLLLKSVWHPDAHMELQAAARAFWGSYSKAIDWERVCDLEKRCATLLGGLLLARIDGKSPVEYIQSERDRRRVRDVARSLIILRTERLEDVFALWDREWGR
jgi:tRNA A-37 threonylcarbamoyl transferase component Bud32